jgi:hypothetical protein
MQATKISSCKQLFPSNFPRRPSPATASYC